MRGEYGEVTRPHHSPIRFTQTFTHCNFAVDPGPRGVRLSDFAKLAKAKAAPAGWAFDTSRFWIEEHGLIMEAPVVPVVEKDAAKPEKYVVTGDREVTTVLTIWPDGKWALEKGSLYDVTHLPCRSALYWKEQKEEGPAFTPSPSDLKKFPVRPGADMPGLPTCKHKDYAVIFVTAVEAPAA